MITVIIEDEKLAAERLKELIREIDSSIVIAETLSSVEQSIKYFKQNNPDLIFLDIQLEDGLSFSIFDKVEIDVPIIFTTAYDNYAIKAFKLNSIDYLLKPISYKRLEKALQKLEKIKEKKSDEQTGKLQKLLENMQPKPLLKRLPSKIGGKVQLHKVSEIPLFFVQDKLTFAQNIEGRNLPVSYSLSELENRLDKTAFFRLSRNLIINIDFIDEVKFSGRVYIRLKNAKKTEIPVTRERVKSLKDFLGL